MEKFIEKECKSCPLIANCKRVGSSPKILKKIPYRCRIYGGLAKTPIDPSILGEESKKAHEKDGKYMNIVEIPIIDNHLEMIVYDVEKIFVKTPNG